jgi:hypothetical protein
MMNIKAGIRKASFSYGVRYFRDHRSQRSAIQRKETREGRAERSSRNRKPCRKPKPKAPCKAQQPTSNKPNFIIIFLSPFYERR